MEGKRHSGEEEERKGLGEEGMEEYVMETSRIREKNEESRVVEYGRRGKT